MQALAHEQTTVTEEEIDGTLLQHAPVLLRTHADGRVYYGCRVCGAWPCVPYRLANAYLEMREAVKKGAGAAPEEPRGNPPPAWVTRTMVDAGPPATTGHIRKTLDEQVAATMARTRAVEQAGRVVGTSGEPRPDFYEQPSGLTAVLEAEEGPEDRTAEGGDLCPSCGRQKDERDAALCGDCNGEENARYMNRLGGRDDLGHPVATIGA